MDERLTVTNIRRIIYVSGEEYPEKRTVFPADLKANELVLYLSGEKQGESTLYFGNGVYTMKSGTLRLMPKGDHKRYEVERGEERTNGCIDIVFETDRPVCDGIEITQNEGKALEPLFRKAFSVWVSQNEGWYYESLSLLYRILAERQKSAVYLPDEKFGKIRPAVDYMAAHFHEGRIPSAKLADLCGVSYSYVRRLFYEKYGVSPENYLLQMRFNYAADLLLSGEYNVTRAAVSAGFCDVYDFSRRFKSRFGVTPTQYQKKYRSSR